MLEYDYSEEMLGLTEVQKIAVVQWTMKHIVDHAKEGGSYRYLIYDRLGFGLEAYAPLCSDGLTISNEFDLNLKESILEAYISGSENKMKAVLGLCDEPKCFDSVSCIWSGRTTCRNHYEGIMKNAKGDGDLIDPCPEGFCNDI